MPSLALAFTFSLLSGPALTYPGPPDRVLERRGNAVTVTQTVTSRLTSCAASTSKPGKPSVTTAAPVVASIDVQRQGSLWNVPDVGLFSEKAVYIFSGDSLPDGLYASQYTVQDTDDGAPFNHHFTPNNVKVANGFLNLTVPGGQSTTRGATIECAEICTTASNILYGSVRWTAILSNIPGTCHGGFFYRDDTQEIDIEVLTDATSLSNDGPNNPIPIWYSNQATNPVVAPATQDSTVPPAPWTDLTTNTHEYRIDWTPDYTAFYFDGQLQSLFTDNIPSEPGSWVWNNWANGDEGWSVGPPDKDNNFRLENITMYYNTSSG